MAFTKKNYVDLTGLSTFKSSLLGTVINDTNKTTTSKTATIKAITDYVDSEVGDLSSAVTEGLANKVSSVTYDSTNKKIVYNKGGSTNTDVVTVATIKSAIGNFVKSGTGASSGLVPSPGTTAGSSKYLREDGTWVTPPNTTYSVFVKSGSGAKSGLVPSPGTTAGSSKYLREDGTWTTPPDTNTTYSNATSSSAGLMGADDKAKLDGIATNANNYSHPSYTAQKSGLYKITVDALGHVSGVTSVTKADITGLGIPGSDTNTHYTAIPVLGATDAVANATSATANPYLNIVENKVKSGGIQIKGGGATSVSAINGVITISSTDNNTTYSVMTGATSSANGASGLVPAPAKGQQASFLRGDGTWVVPTDTKVTSAVGNTTKAYLVGSTSSSDATGTLIKDTNVYLDTTAGQLVATTFVGSLSGTATKATQDSAGQQINTTYIKSLSASGQTVTITKGNGSTSTFTTQDTKNTAGSTDTGSKIYLIGATSQASNPQTYSDDQVYALNGQLGANTVKVAEKVTLQYNSSTESLDFVFA